MNINEMTPEYYYENCQVGWPHYSKERPGAGCNEEVEGWNMLGQIVTYICTAPMPHGPNDRHVAEAMTVCAIREAVQ